MQFDADRSGTVEPHEMHQALTAFGKSVHMHICTYSNPKINLSRDTLLQVLSAWT